MDLRSDWDHSLFRTIRERPIIFDGAMGTEIQRREPTPDDYGGRDGLPEILVRTRPDWIREIHASYVEAGADVIETDSFGANAVVLAEYGLESEILALNRDAARLARETADSFASRGGPRFVAGSMGPGTKLPSLRAASFADLRASYCEQARGLMAGGADLLIVETCQDPLQIKAALAGIRAAFAAEGRRIPVSVSFTVETTGTMLVGTEAAALVAILEPYPIASLGLNCATGPREMIRHVRTLAAASPFPLSVMPNAGLPENVGGRAVYPLGPEAIADALRAFVKGEGAAIIGGCCGTTPAHIAAIRKAVEGLRPVREAPAPGAAAASLYSVAPLRQEPPPAIIGERTNANGSRRFRELLLAGDYEGIVEMAQGEAAGSHLLDVCVAYVGRDESRDMREVAGRLATAVSVPLVIDSTEPEVIRDALELCGGRCVVNSVNLEDGGERLRRIAPLARELGAALVVLTIDEEGMAKTAERKLAIAERIQAILTDEFGFRPHDLLFDPLTFTLGSGDPEFRRAGVETLEAVASIKRRLPGASTILGVSNISFGLAPAARKVLNSVFLEEAIASGLDAAIIHAEGIVPGHRIDPEARAWATRLVRDEKGPGGRDPLEAFIEVFSGPAPVVEEAEDEPLDRKLAARIRGGRKRGIESILDPLLETRGPLEIINDILIPAMKEVGDLFAAGAMQLPFVLRAAEAMKAAVKHLEPRMPKAGADAARGSIVLATVRGDVHDIGKNLVDIILTNNGFRVFNLGIKVPIEAMLEAFEREKATAIGMSGLLVKSTAVMRENLEEMERRGLRAPVLLGGAALTRRYVEEDLRRIYGGSVFYGKDAFEGLAIMRSFGPDGTRIEKETPASGSAPQAVDRGAVSDERALLIGRGAVRRAPQGARSSVRRDIPIPRVPFLGERVIDALPLEEIYPLINQVALFRGRWGYRRGAMDRDEYERLIENEVRPAFEMWKRRGKDEGLFAPKAVYGYWPCHADGDDVIVFDPDGAEETARFTFPRQPDPPHLAIADFFRPVEAEERDWIGMFVVTIGPRAEERAREAFGGDRYREYLLLHGFGVELADAAAEYVHALMRREAGIGAGDATTVSNLVRQGYRGSRYSFGYPACPDLADQRKLFRLLRPERIGVALTEGDQMDPEASVSAIVVHHPEAKYFAIDAGTREGGT
ncbi:MAG: methionine synthase [Planctomycetes bacterium]|nr:methionine synthase [Planctomycetota bacterium]